MYPPGNSSCLSSVHACDANGAARNDLAGLLLSRFDKMEGQRQVDYGSFLHAVVQHERSPGVVHIHQHVNIDSMTPMESGLSTSEVDESLCDVFCMRFTDWSSVLSLGQCSRWPS